MKKTLYKIFKIFFLLSSVMIIMACKPDVANNTSDTNNTNDKNNTNDTNTDTSDKSEVETEKPNTENNTKFESAFDAVYNMKSGVNLGNGFDSTSFNENEFLLGKEGWILQYTDKSPNAWETAWGQPATTKELIQGIKKAGFNAVRVPVTWAEHMNFETGKIDDVWMNRVQQVVDWIIEEDMYCLLNTHHDGGTDGWVEASYRAYDKYKSVYSKLYTNIANRFKHYSEKLILCGTNEMISADNKWGNGNLEDIDAVNKWNQLFVDTVRATGGNNTTRNLLVGTYVCSTEESDLKSFKKPKDIYDNHLILEVHIYSPKGFVWSQENWIGDWGTEWKSYWESQVINEFDRVKKYADKYGMPVIIGEWGTLGRRFPGKNEDGTPKWNSTTDEEGAKFTSFFIKESRERGFTSFYWDTQEIVNRADGTITSPLMVKGICDNY